MISKPLFKQSCKANAGIWTFVTAITCFMLAIIIGVLGNLNVNEIRSSMTDMFVSDAIESTIESQSMTYYNMADGALTNYQTKYDDLKDLLQLKLNDTVKTSTIEGYKSAISSGMTDEQAREYLTNGQSEENKQAINALLDYYLYYQDDYAVEKIFTDEKISSYVLNGVADAIYNKILIENDEETAENAKTFITNATQSYVQSGSSNVKEFATAYIPNVLKGVFYEQSFDHGGEIISISKYFTEEQIHDTSYTAIVTFRAQLEVKEGQIREQNPAYTEEEVAQELEEYKGTIIVEYSKSIADQLPEKVADALGEIGDLDVYGLVLGSIFYRIAGLLLPMIFVIMTANNLIAGQVDSGSMAYVLSTPTKRRTVTITQMCYMLCSLFAMFALTTITSVLGLAIVGSSEITITYGQILLLNLGAFITMVAVSGICFLASAWFNRSKISMSVGGGLTMFFLVATILGLFGSTVIPSAIRIDAMKYFNYVSIITLFDATSILGGTLTYLWKFAILLVIGIVTYTVGIIKFNKKDLPL